MLTSRLDDHSVAVLRCALDGIGGRCGESCALMWRRVAARYLEIERVGAGLVNDLRVLCAYGPEPRRS